MPHVFPGGPVSADRVSCLGRGKGTQLLFLPPRDRAVSGDCSVVGLVPPAFALVLLIGFWAAMLLSGRAGRMGERHAAKAGLLLAPFAFLLAALVVLFQRRMPTSSTRAVQVRNAVIQVVTELFDSSHQDSLSFTGYGAPMTGSPGMTDLTNAGDCVLPTKPCCASNLRQRIIICADGPALFIRAPRAGDF